MLDMYLQEPGETVALNLSNTNLTKPAAIFPLAGAESEASFLLSASHMLPLRLLWTSLHGWCMHMDGDELIVPHFCPE